MCPCGHKDHASINPATAAPVRLICGVIASSMESLERVYSVLEKCIPGPYEALGPFPFDFTDYYCAEMGQNLIRMIWVMPGLYSLENLHFVKSLTNSIETSLSKDLKRSVNLDPGYMTLAKVVLFSTKDYTHRIYIGDNIFAESTLRYKNGGFKPFDYTYQDYKSPEVTGFLNDQRQTFSRELKALKKSGRPFECIDFASLMSEF